MVITRSKMHAATTPIFPAAISSTSINNPGVQLPLRKPEAKKSSVDSPTDNLVLGKSGRVIKQSSLLRSQRRIRKNIIEQNSEDPNTVVLIRNQKTDLTHVFSRDLNMFILMLKGRFTTDLNMRLQKSSNETTMSLTELMTNAGEAASIQLSAAHFPCAFKLLSIQPSTISGAGMGVFAREEIKHNEKILFYHGGEYIDKETALERKENILRTGGIT
ncbi:hypothetical protein RCL1_008620 [Eukaryota sp. TZLM3-RCL]